MRLPDVFAYLDYRAFLRDVYAARKARARGFSFRTFSRVAGLRSPNYLKLVMDGERNLGEAMAPRFATALGLSDDAGRYFVDLVAFNQAKDAITRNAAYARLRGFRRYRSAHRLELAHAAYHSTWYLPAIRELAARQDFQAEPAWVASRLRPRIAKEEARGALATLFELGLLVKDPKGGAVQGEALISTGPETRDHHIGNYHRTCKDGFIIWRRRCKRPAAQIQHLWNNIAVNPRQGEDATKVWRQTKGQQTPRIARYLGLFAKAHGKGLLRGRVE